MPLDLPMIFAAVIAAAVFLYVVLDGFDLGVGILFPFTTSEERDVMTASIAPVWDGNETWLVLGGGGLFAAFPLAYAILMPALYAPIGFMLTALIFRGVAFEFRANAGPSGRGKRFWTAAFAGGSIAATISQGFVLGGFLQGVDVKGRAFAGGSLDWATPFSLLVALALVAGYALLGAAWLVYKTEGALLEKARRWTARLVAAVAVAIAAVSLATLTLDPEITRRWGLVEGGLDISRALILAPLPLLAAAGLLVCFRGAQAPKGGGGAYLGALLVFLSGFGGLAVSLFPTIVPFAVTVREAAAADNALALMLVGVALMLPVILGYTAYVYWIFRGKVAPGAAYH